MPWRVMVTVSSSSTTRTFGGGASPVRDPPVTGSSRTMQQKELTGLGSPLMGAICLADSAQASERRGELFAQEALGKPGAQRAAWHIADDVHHHSSGIGLRVQLEPG